MTEIIYLPNRRGLSGTVKGAKRKHLAGLVRKGRETAFGECIRLLLLQAILSRKDQQRLLGILVDDIGQLLAVVVVLVRDALTF